MSLKNILNDYDRGIISFGEVSKKLRRLAAITNNQVLAYRLLKVADYWELCGDTMNQDEFMAECMFLFDMDHKQTKG